MNRWEIQQSAMVMGCEEMSGVVASVSQSSNRGPVVCPKPRRLGLGLGFLSSDLTMSLRWQRSSQPAEVCDSKAGAELLDLILMKEGYGEELSSREMGSSPPFFCGTPPCRVSNPLVHDANFGDEKLSPLSTLQLASVSPSPSPSSSSASSSMSPSAMKAGSARMKFGLKPATVRVEGFDCLSRDRRQNSGITAVA